MDACQIVVSVYYMYLQIPQFHMHQSNVLLLRVIDKIVGNLLQNSITSTILVVRDIVTILHVSTHEIWYGMYYTAHVLL